MKRILMLLLIFMAIGLAQFTRVYQVSDLFPYGNAWYDSVKTVPGETFSAVHTTSAADTIISDWVSLYGGGGDVFVMMRRDTVVNPTVGVEFWIGVYRLPGYPDGTATEWHKLATITGEGTATATLVDSTWWNSAPTHQIKFKLIEKGATENYLLIGFTHFKQGR